ncbi:MAG: 30S ribosomal protein S20 [Deltaproteobacteria bacterium]|nr:30S ribosomal protein S20 [Deltaproteobacteria bacterium]
MAEAPKQAGQTQKRKIPKGRHRSAFKRQRQNLKRFARNRSIRSELKTVARNVRDAVIKKNKELAQSSLRLAMSAFAKAGARNKVHPQHASRHIARLSSLVQSL